MRTALPPKRGPSGRTTLPTAPPGFDHKTYKTNQNGTPRKAGDDGEAARTMFDNMFFYLFLSLLFFGIGDILGVATKAKVSAVFVSLGLFLIFFMMKVIPPDIIKQAGLTELGRWGVIFIVFSMGTTINLKQFIAEWRSLATAILSMIVVMIAGLALIPIIGYEETIVSVPILNGGIVATQIMTSAAMEQGFQMAAALGTIVFAVQKFFGTPVASYFGMREAKLIVEEMRRNGAAAAAAGGEEAAKPEEEKKLLFWERHKRYYGQFASLAITAFFAWIAFMLGKWTGVSGTIWALILGTVVSATGYVPGNILKHANSSGIFNVAVFATIIPSLANIKAGDLVTLGIALVIMFVITFAVLFLFFYVLPCWKILGSRNVAMGVACCQLLGFPATYLVVNEVAGAAGETEAERKAITDRLMAKYLIGGFATVTSLSVISAGFFEKLL